MPRPKGFKLSEESKRKIGEAHKGKKLSEECKIKISKSLKGTTLWNRGLTKETDKRIRKQAKERIGYKHTKETKRKIEEANKGNKLGPQSEEVKRKISKSLKGRFLKEESSQWKGGVDTGNQHKKAWELFGKGCCEICGISLKEYKKKSGRRFSMHCRDKNYFNLSIDNWLTVCEYGCHQKIDKLDGIWGYNMESEIELEKKVGDILPGQGWCELHGCFTVDELRDLIVKINMNYKEPEKGNKKQ